MSSALLGEHDPAQAPAKAGPPFNRNLLRSVIEKESINMLGELISEIKGKITGRRVLDLEGPTIETSVSTSGNVTGTKVNESITFVFRPVSTGVLHGKGQGVIMAGESEMATFAAEGLGKITSSGIRWRGAGFYRTSSTGKLSFLNNIVGVFESENDNEGNFTEKIWEWK